MRKATFLPFLLISMIAACGPQPQPSPATALPGTLTPAATEITIAVDHPGLPLPLERGRLFVASGLCTLCHTQMTDVAGNDVSTDTSWRASMMANSARDPYWQASVRGEVLSHPAYEAVIEDKCSTCHMPMAHFTATAEGEQGHILDDGFLVEDHALHVLAVDGVSCTLCHQIREKGFYQQESFSGGYGIDTELPTGEREAFGPYDARPGLVQIMQGSSGFVPLQGLHIQESALCATCHILYTPYTDAAGQIVGEFPEQTAYLEWLASGYADSVSCQGCHMPPAQDGVQLSITGGPRRQPFYQHTFVGGNHYMLEMLKTFAGEVQATASSAQFRDKQARVIEQMGQRTGAVVVENAALQSSTLTVDVVVANRVGHKLPTGFPARRVWVHLTVQDAGGQMIFESGAVDADGAITGNDNDTDPATYEPHYQTIDRPDQVQIYEAIMSDTDGQVTTTLLKGAGYLKDNRLLPMGFDKGAAGADVAAYGAAAEDEDFVGASDQIQYIVAIGEAQGPFTVIAELLYQSIGYRWADNLRRYDAPEPARFIGYYKQVSNQPVVVANTSLEVRE